MISEKERTMCNRIKIASGNEERYKVLVEEIKNLGANPNYSDQSFPDRLFRLSTIIGNETMRDIPEHYLPLYEVLARHLDTLIEKYLDTQKGALVQ